MHISFNRVQQGYGWGFLILNIQYIIAQKKRDNYEEIWKETEIINFSTYFWHSKDYRRQEYKQRQFG